MTRLELPRHFQRQQTYVRKKKKKNVQPRQHHHASLSRHVFPLYVGEITK